MNFNFANVLSTQVQLADVKVFANNGIKIGEAAAARLGLNPETHYIFIDKNLTDGKWYIAAMEIVKDEEGKVISGGKFINKHMKLTHVRLAHDLGGQYSEFALGGDGIESGGTTYFTLEETVNGATKRADIATRATAMTEEEIEEVVNEQPSLDGDILEDEPQLDMTETEKAEVRAEAIESVEQEEATTTEVDPFA